MEHTDHMRSRADVVKRSYISIVDRLVAVSNVARQTVDRLVDQERKDRMKPPVFTQMLNSVQVGIGLEIG